MPRSGKFLQTAVLFLAAFFSFSSVSSAQGPQIEWTWQAGPSAGWKTSATVADASGFTYVTGRVSSDFREGNLPYPQPLGDGDAYLAKLSSSGALVYFTYLGGSGDDEGMSVSVSPSGLVCVAGRTTSSDFPISQGSPQQGRGFIAVIDPAIGEIVYSARFGANNTVLKSVKFDASGNLWFAGPSTQTGSLVGRVQAVQQPGERILQVTSLPGQATGLVPAGAYVYVVGALNDQSGGFLAEYRTADFPTATPTAERALAFLPKGVVHDASIGSVVIGGASVGSSRFAPNSGGTGQVQIEITPIGDPYPPSSPGFQALPNTSVYFSEPLVGVAIPTGGQYLAAGDDTWQFTAATTPSSVATGASAGIRAIASMPQSSILTIVADASATVRCFHRP